MRDASKSIPVAHPVVGNKRDSQLASTGSGREKEMRGCFSPKIVTGAIMRESPTREM
jgi:hypothetical protein